MRNDPDCLITRIRTYKYVCLVCALLWYREGKFKRRILWTCQKRATILENDPTNENFYHFYNSITSVLNFHQINDQLIDYYNSKALPKRIYDAQHLNSIEFINSNVDDDEDKPSRRIITHMSPRIWEESLRAYNAARAAENWRNLTYLHENCSTIVSTQRVAIVSVRENQSPIRYRSIKGQQPRPRAVNLINMERWMNTRDEFFNLLLALVDIFRWIGKRNIVQFVDHCVYKVRM